MFSLASHTIQMLVWTESLRPCCCSVHLQKDIKYGGCSLAADVDGSPQPDTSNWLHFDNSNFHGYRSALASTQNVCYQPLTLCNIGAAELLG